jgi:hypothetical protein
MAKSGKITLIVILGCVVSAFSYAQTINIEQQLIGTWLEVGNNENWVFNSNGTISRGTETGSYAVIGSKLAIRFIGADTTIVVDVFISTDGRRVILAYNAFGVGHLLNKR